VAGETFSQSFPPTPNQTFTFTWDGKDGYGRTVPGIQTATIRIGYVYGGVYFGVDRATGSFGGVGTAPISADIGRIEITVWQEETAPVGNFAAQSQDALGAWTLNVHHSYDPISRVINFGDGTRRSGDSLKAVIDLAIPNTNAANLNSPGIFNVAVDAQGNFFLEGVGLDNPPPGTFGLIGVLKRAPDGTITAYPDPNVADAIKGGFAVDAHGNMYFARQVFGQGPDSQVLKLTPDGQEVLVAGNGFPGFSGDGGPAIDAFLNRPSGLALDAQGDLLIADYGNHRVRRVSPDGIITTVVGNGTGGFRGGFSGDGGLAVNAELSFPTGVAVDAQGNLYVADTGNERIRKVTPDGIITTIAGGGAGGVSDGIPAIEATLGMGNGAGIVIDNQGDVIFEDPGHERIRFVSPAGTIFTLAGNGNLGGLPGQDNGDRGPATAASLRLDNPLSLALNTKGEIFFAESFEGVRRIGNFLPGFTAANISIPSTDGNELYVFDSAGKHLETVDALTGGTLFSFGYDSAGRLTSISDGDNNVTHIERDANGIPTAIVAPFGQRTTLTVDPHGYLASITDPAGGMNQYSYSADGLMATFTDPVNNVHHFSYDPLGRLHVDQDPAGGSTTLDLTGTANGLQVTLTRAETATQNLVSTYLVETLPTEDMHFVNTGPDGLHTDMVMRSDGSTTLTSPDGTIETLVEGPDPRFGMQAPVTASDTTTTPGGVTSVVTEQRSAMLMNPSNPLSLQSWTDTVALNGNSFVETFDAASRTFTNTSPAGRHEVTIVDVLGRPVSDRIGNQQPIHATYDNHGFLTAVGQGSGATDRTFTFTRDSQENVATITNPLSQISTFGYDAAGRPDSLTLPGGQQTTRTYYADGNVQSLTPAGLPEHTFTYTPNGLLQSYTPPGVGSGSTTISYGTNLNGQLNQITEPDGRQLTVGYDNAGRLQTITQSGGQIAYAYDSNTGNVHSATAPDGGVLAYSYDGFLPTGLTWTGAVHGQVTQTYNNNFDVASQTVNGGAPVQFQYDHDGLLTQAGSLSLSLDPATGLLNGTTLGSITTANQYDPFGELSTSAASFNGTALYSTQYTPDALGRSQQVIETIGVTTNIFVCGYDRNGQLSQVTENGTVIATYAYDANGNRTSLTTATATVTASYNAQDQLTQLGNNTYRYAADGSLASKTSGNQTTTYSYDLLGNLTHVTLPDGTSIDYIIDGAGQRIGKKVNGTLVKGFLYDDQGRPIAELDGNNNIVSQFVYGSDGSTPDYMIRGGRTYQILTDYLGSPRLVVDVATSAVAQRLDYDVWGNVVQDTNPGFQPFGFAGGLFDSATNLVRFGKRDYDPEAGRFTQRDPVGFGSGNSNLYTYAANEPNNLVDPLGETPQKFHFRPPKKGGYCLIIVTPSYTLKIESPAGACPCNVLKGRDPTPFSLRNGWYQSAVGDQAYDTFNMPYEGGDQTKSEHEARKAAEWQFATPEDGYVPTPAFINTSSTSTSTGR
jgi:RHS repeat-associated protein